MCKRNDFALHNLLPHSTEGTKIFSISAGQKADFSSSHVRGCSFTQVPANNVNLRFYGREDSLKIEPNLKENNSKD